MAQSSPASRSPGSVTARIRAIGTSGTCIPNDAYDGPANLSQLRSPESLAVAPSGVLYIADTGNYAIRVLTAAGGLATLAVDGDLGVPDALALDPTGNLYLADMSGNVIHKLTPPTAEGLR